MNKKNEELHKIIANIQTKLKCDFMEAVLEFCLENEIDPEDIIQQMDSITIEKLKQVAIENNMIQKRVSNLKVNQLNLE